jgi:hypothetical protein
VADGAAAADLTTTHRHMPLTPLNTDKSIKQKHSKS